MLNQVYSQSFQLDSPDGNLQIRVEIADQISWSAFLDGDRVIERVQVGMDFSEAPDFGHHATVKTHHIQSHSSMIYPIVPHKDAEIKDEYNECSIEFKDRYRLNFRAYNDGMAYQFIDEGKKERKVNAEQLTLSFPEETSSLFPQEASIYSHNERTYLNKSLTDITRDELCSLPALFITGDTKILLTETALHDYPGMFLRGNGNFTVDALFPNYVLEAVPDENGPDRSQNITKEADYIAKVSGRRRYPWRVFIITNDDRKLVASNLTYQLARPTAIENTNWIKPGKVAWDWYNANNIFGVDFKSGINSATYKYYIDFAAVHNLEYVILDEGWSKSTTEILDFNPAIDLQELISYGDGKDVGIILWVLWRPLYDQLHNVLETYKSWGVKGVKVDFMQRNDQYMVNAYEKMAKACAQNELIIDFHGSFKPSGLRRMYPNVINYEGVKGAEHNKWSRDITPEHNVTIPFTRMVAGPMDYTPGAMYNRQKNNYGISFERPMSQGTRAHQVAMYIVYEAPLQMLCESPSTYYKEQETLDFIKKIPTVWDKTIVLEGVVGDYIAIARKHGDKWFLGAMTDWDARSLDINLSFLGDGSFEMDMLKDGINAGRFAEDYKIDRLDVNNRTKVTIDMSAGGGWAAIITGK